MLAQTSDYPKSSSTSLIPIKTQQVNHVIRLVRFLSSFISPSGDVRQPREKHENLHTIKVLTRGPTEIPVLAEGAKLRACDTMDRHLRAREPVQPNTKE
jgi:hypothetical protein